MKIKRSDIYDKKKIPIKGVKLSGQKIRALEDEGMTLRQFKRRFNVR